MQQIAQYRRLLLLKNLNENSAPELKFKWLLNKNLDQNQINLKKLIGTI